MIFKMPATLAQPFAMNKQTTALFHFLPCLIKLQFLKLCIRLLLFELLFFAGLVNKYILHA